MPPDGACFAAEKSFVSNWTLRLSEGRYLNTLKGFMPLLGQQLVADVLAAVNDEADTETRARLERKFELVTLGKRVLVRRFRPENQETPGGRRRS